MPSQAGKIAIVTGATSGIGYETALALYQKGAHVVVGARDRKKAIAAIKLIRKSGGTGQLTFIHLDLTSLAAVRHFAYIFNMSFHTLDLLINNAGVMMPPQTKTSDGFELQFGVNFLAHFLLTGLLYSTLQITPGARVVTLGSGAYKQVTAVDYENLHIEKDYNAPREYAISKLACLQFAIELQRKIKNRGHKVLSLAAHPGVTESELSRHMEKEALSIATEKFGGLMPTARGALPVLFAATSKDVTAGGYYGPDGENELRGYPAPAFVTDDAKDEQKTSLLWRHAEQLTGLSYPG